MQIDNLLKCRVRGALTAYLTAMASTIEEDVFEEEMRLMQIDEVSSLLEVFNQ